MILSMINLTIHTIFSAVKSFDIVFRLKVQYEIYVFLVQTL